MSNLIPYSTDYEIEEIEVLDQLDTICQSQLFASKKILCEFLSYVVSETLAGRASKIKGYTIGVEVFDKGVEFDPQLDSLVRINAGRLRRALKNYYEREGIDDTIHITIPKGAYVPEFKRMTPAPYHDKANSLEFEDKRDSSGKPGIAILAFKNISGDSAYDYLGCGLVEELAVELTEYEDLIVYDCAPWSNTLYANGNLRDYINSHNIEFMLDGAFLKSDEKVTFLVKLTDAINGNQIWAQRYTHDIKSCGLIEMLENISQNTATILGSQYGIILENLGKEGNRLQYREIDAFNAVLKFYNYIAYQTPEAAEQAFLALKKVVEKEPSATAMACLAIMHSDSYLFDELIQPDSYRQVDLLAEEAAQLDPNSSLVNTILAIKHFIYDDRGKFKHQFEKCLQLGPELGLNKGSVAVYAMLFGQWDRGREIIREVIANNFKYPLFFHAALLLYHFRMKHYENALTESDRFNLPFLFWSPLLRTAVLGQLNKIKEANESMLQLKSLKPNFEMDAPYLISRIIKEKNLADLILEGLRKAGMKL